MSIALAFQRHARTCLQPNYNNGFRQCLPFSWTTLRGKHCQHPIAVMGVVDKFRLFLHDSTTNLHFTLSKHLTNFKYPPKATYRGMY